MGIRELTALHVVGPIETAVSRHLGRTWRVESVSDLGERASHPAALFLGAGLSVFVKMTDGPQHVVDELAGLELLRTAAGVRVPIPVGPGWVELPGDYALLVSEGLAEREPADRTRSDWESIGQALARIHRVTGAEFGLGHAGWFGPLRQDNRPVPTNRWADFYAARRLAPWLVTAGQGGHVPGATLARVEQLIERLPELVGPEPEPRLVHGDAQHHNFVSTAEGAVVIDASPYFGHPELDLALLDYFVPVPPETFSAYAEASPLADDFAERRELWRIFAYLAVLTVDGGSTWGSQFVGRLDEALTRYV